MDNRKKIPKNEMFTAFEPKQSNRWRMEFPKELINIPDYTVKHVSPIRYDVEKREWDELTITLYDPVNPSTSKVLCEMINNFTIVGNFTLKNTMLGPVGDNVEEIYFEKCNFKSVDFGETDYSLSELKVITLIVKFKKCVIS